MDPAVTWSQPRAVTRLLSGHRWGWYRWPAAFIVAGMSGTAVNGPLTDVQAMSCFYLMIAALLWWLPGPRPGVGTDREGVVLRGWMRQRRLSWSDVELVRLGAVRVASGSIPGVAVHWKGRDLRLRTCPLVSVAARDRWIAPVLAGARTAGVPVILESGYEFAFPRSAADLRGGLQGGPAAWEAEPPRVDPRRGAVRTLVALTAAFVLSSAIVIGGLFVEAGEVVALAATFAGLSGWLILVIAWPAWRYWRVNPGDGPDPEAGMMQR